jgi:hypothetical protein
MKNLLILLLCIPSLVCGNPLGRSRGQTHSFLPVTSQHRAQQPGAGREFTRRNLILVGGNLVPWRWYYENYPTDLYNEDGTPLSGTPEPSEFLEEPDHNELEQTGCYNDCMNRPETKLEKECDQECGASE